MSLAPGVRLGAYEVVALIGAGGMGEVYRARDTRLGRDVAVKVLPASLSSDGERLRRFEQEARAAAALSHPNVLAVFDIGQHDAAPYIVSELLEGETLRARLGNGPMPVRKAIDCAIQIARGLSAAHERGIVHRDLKPENIFITSDDRAKILDFGLAKLTEPEGAARGTSDVPTSPPDTQAGMVLGTVGYMAPEQVRGLTVDHRADVFAFGAVLYEMLSGQRAFRGDTPADTMSAILKEDPADLPLAERHIPPALARMVDRCIEKNAASRFHSLHDLAIALEALSSHSEMAAGAPTRASSRQRSRRAWAAVVVFASAAAAAGAIFYLRPGGIVSSPLRFAITPPPNATFSLVGGAGAGQIVPIVSPDGRRVVFGVTKAGISQLLVRALDSFDAQPLVGSEGGQGIFWSPDSRKIAFVEGGKLKTIDASGGPAQTLADSTIGGGGTWNHDGQILFNAGVGGLSMIPAAGGAPVQVTKPDESRGQTRHQDPWFLPDGKHFLFTTANAIWVGNLSGGQPVRVLDADSQAVYANGNLLFVRQGTLMAQPFDLRSLTLDGNAVPVAERILLNAVTRRAAFSASATGVLAFRTGEARPMTRLVWADRSGKSLGGIGEPGRYRNPVLSPDNTRVAIQVGDPAERNEDIWVIELAEGNMSRFTFDPNNDTYPVWSPDGKWIMYASDRDQNGGWNLYRKLASGAGDEELIRKSAADERPHSWSPDGKYIVYRRSNPGSNLGVFALDGDRKPLPLPPGTYGTGLGQVSPNGRWIAFGSVETGRYEVVVRGFPTPGGKWQISKDGALSPRWRGDSKELFYYAFDSRVVAVPVTGEVAPEFGTEVPLFTARMLNGPTAPTGFRAQYDVTRDGQLFLLNVPAEDAQPPSISVVVNWTAGLKGRN